jgi:outer membrane protein assembly factor BamB
MYSNHYFADTDGGTLAKYKYPDVYNKTFVCPDPLCNHKNSGCPFFNAGSAIAYYEGKIYFNTESGNIYVYDISEGKRSKLADNSIMPRFIKYDGKLYLQYLKEYNDFNINMVYFIILPSGEMTELGQLSDINTNFGIIYNNKYYID